MLTDGFEKSSLKWIEALLLPKRDTRSANGWRGEWLEKRMEDKIILNHRQKTIDRYEGII